MSGTGSADSLPGGPAATSRRGGPWARARALAARTRPTRNRYVDFLRAASIVVVVLGHWLMAAPTVATGERFTLSDLLHVLPWTQWLTWVFQVMPLFFIVGGYANAASLESAARAGTGYAGWVSHRLQRLVRPLVPFVLVWCGLALVARRLGLSEGLVRAGSQVAFVPTWFLAAYVVLVLVAPAMHRLWRRFGLASFWALVVAAAVVDVGRRAPGLQLVGWVNYAFVWLAVHQLGYAWREGTLGRGIRGMTFALGGLAALVVLVGLASYPVSMVTVPGERLSNSNPPTLALLALGVTQAGLVLLVEGPARRLLQRPRAWTATVAVNGVIMTLYLWHATVMVLLVALAELPGGVGLHFTPGTPTWWATRVPWLLGLLAGLAVFVAVFGRVEARVTPPSGPPPAPWRSVGGALALCVGLTALGVGGIGAPNPLGLRLWAVLVTLAGAVLVAAVRLPGVGLTPSAGTRG